MKNIKLLLSLYGPTLLILVLSLNANAQCNQSDTVISTNTTWTNQDVQLTDNQKITVIGATLTLNNCTLRRKVGCSGYWDGIYLATTELGAKACNTPHLLDQKVYLLS